MTSGEALQKAVHSESVQSGVEASGAKHLRDYSGFARSAVLETAPGSDVIIESMGDEGLEPPTSTV